MAPLLGMLGGAGLLLIWWSAWEKPETAPRKPRTSRLEDLLRTAGIEKVSAAGLLASCVGVGVFTTLAFFAATGSGPIAGCFGLFGGWLPMAMVRWRARKRTAVLRQLWPDVVDHLRSAIRAGLSLPEALIQLGEKGPEELRHVFVDFGSDYRSGGQFDPSLTRLKERLADPVADRWDGARRRAPRWLHQHDGRAEVGEQPTAVGAPLDGGVDHPQAVQRPRRSRHRAVSPPTAPPMLGPVRPPR